jgi:hypothetical protein
MRLDELKNDLPETPEFIHSMIQEEVYNQINNENVVPFRKDRKTKWNMSRVAVAVLACLMGMSAVAYAGNKMYHMYLERKGQYSVATGIGADEESEKIALPEKINDIEITAGYIPEGMEWIEENKLSYSDTPYLGGISITSVLMDQDDLGEEWIDQGVVESEELTLGEHDGVYVKFLDLKQDKSFDKRIYMLYPEEYRVFTIYFGDDVTKADAIKFAENMTVTEKDEMIETKGMLTWSDLINRETDTTDTTDAAEVKTEVAEDDITIYGLGDSMSVEAMYEDRTGNIVTSDGVSVRVDDVQLYDDLSVLEEDSIPEEWTTAVADDGKLKQNNLSYVKAGDGENTLDKVINEASVDQKLVYATVTYTNNTDSELDHVLYLGNLMTMKHENGSYRTYIPEEEPGTDYDYFMGDGVAMTGEMTYFSVHEEYGNGGNYIESLKPGESIQVAMAWIVNESDLEDLYLNLNSDSGIYEFTDSMLKTGIVYIGG